MNNLYRFQVLYLPTYLDLFARHIADGDNAPHAVARQQLGILADILRPDGYSRQAEVGKGGVVLVAPLVEGDGHLVYHPVLAVFADDAFYAFRFRTVHIIVPDYLLDFLQSIVDDFLVIAGAILSQQILQHVGGHRQSAFHEESQVLPHHLADKGIQYLLLQFHHSKSKSFSIRVLFVTFSLMSGFSSSAASNTFSWSTLASTFRFKVRST